MSFTSIDNLENESLINNILNQINSDDNKPIRENIKPQPMEQSTSRVTTKSKDNEKNEKNEKNNQPNVLELILNIIKDPIIVGLLVTVIASPILQEKLTTLIPLFSAQPSIKNTIIRFFLGFSLFIAIKQLSSST